MRHECLKRMHRQEAKAFAETVTICTMSAATRTQQMNASPARCVISAEPYKAENMQKLAAL